MRRRSAPVKAPFSWPNSSDSSRFSGIAAQLRARNGGPGPGAVLVDGRATSSLPVPLSPVIRTGTSWAGDPADGLVHLAHCRTAADDGPVHVGVRGGLGHHGRLAHPPGHLQRLADHPPQLVRVERLEQVVVGALLHRLDGRVRPLGHGDEDDRDARVDAADLLVDLQAGLVGQAQVEENDVRRPGADPLESFGSGAGHLDPVSRRGERLAYLPRNQGRVIVNEQQVGHGWRVPGSSG